MVNQIINIYLLMLSTLIIIGVSQRKANNSIHFNFIEYWAFQISLIVIACCSMYEAFTYQPQTLEIDGFFLIKSYLTFLVSAYFFYFNRIRNY